jgi:hypothetical protein
MAGTPPHEDNGQQVFNPESFMRGISDMVIRQFYGTDDSSGYRGISSWSFYLQQGSKDNNCTSYHSQRALPRDSIHP